MTLDDEKRLRSFARDSENLRMLFAELDRTRLLLKDTVIDLGKAQEDAKFWRNAIKAQCLFESRGDMRCFFCDRLLDPIPNNHAEDCPWVLAKESE